MDINQIIDLMVNNCFPIALSAYLLIRLEKQLNILACSINRLNSIISAKLGIIIDTGSDDSNSKRTA